MSDGLSIRPQTLRLTPHYRRLRDAILRPHLRLTESRYFWEKWKPRLGPDAAVLVMEVRDRCNRALASTGLAAGPNGLSDPFNHHPPDGEVGGQPQEGDGCTVSASELAAACGFSRVTLWRLLQREDVRRFVRVEHNYVYDRRLGKKRRTVSTYHVLMEDPLVEEDEARLEELVTVDGGTGAAASMDGAGSGRGFSGEVGGEAPTVQSETLVVDNSPPRFQPATNRGGSIPKPQNVFQTLFKERWDPNVATPPSRSTLPTFPTANGLFAAGHQPEVFVPPPAAPDRGARRSVPEVDMWRKYPELAHFVEEAEQLLGDTHSRGFYLKALKRLHPGHMGVWQRALGVAREQPTIRRSRGALFTRLLRTFAAESGVEL